MFIVNLNDSSRAGVLALNVSIDEFIHETSAKDLIARLYATTLAELSWAEITTGKHVDDAQLECGDFTVFASPDLERVREFLAGAI